MRILLVEDDAQVSTMLASTLRQQNHVIDVAIDGEEGWDLLEVCPYEMIILDVVLPKLDGISFCKRLRQQKKEVLVMLLTARSDQSERILGLDAGADDYVVKPCMPEEIAARVRALQRRGSSSTPILEWGQLCIDPAKREVTFAGQVLNFRPKEYTLLELFLRNPQRIFSRREILDRLWSVEDDPPNEATIKAHIKGIRHVLRAVNAEDLILTRYGQGYGLNAEYGTPRKSKTEKTQAIVADIWQQVKGLSYDRLAVLQQAVNQLKAGQISEALRTEAMQNAHRLTGALGMFGFRDGSEMAKRLEQLFEANHFDPRTVCQIEELLRYLKWYISANDRGQPAPKPDAGDLDSFSKLTASPHSDRTIAKVLAIDDDVMVLNFLQELLLPFGVEVVALDSPVLLWQTLEAVQPHLILLDVQMPGKTGLEVCQAIRASDRWCWLPIIFLTVCQDLDTQSRIFELGGDDYLLKPVVPSILATRILNRILRFQTIQQHAIAALTPPHPISRHR